MTREIDERRAYEQMHKFISADPIGKMFVDTQTQSFIEGCKDNGIFDPNDYLTKTKEIVGSHLDQFGPINLDTLVHRIVTFEKMMGVFDSPKIVDPYSFSRDLAVGLEGSLRKSHYNKEDASRLNPLGELLNERVLDNVPDELRDNQRREEVDQQLSTLIKDYFLDELREAYISNDTQGFSEAFGYFTRLATHRKNLVATNLDEYLADALLENKEAITSIRQRAKIITQDEKKYNAQIISQAVPGNEEKYEHIIRQEEERLSLAQERSRLYIQTKNIAQKLTRFFYHGCSEKRLRNPEFGIVIIQDDAFVFPGSAPLVDDVMETYKELSQAQEIIKSRIDSQLYCGFLPNAVGFTKDRSAQEARIYRLTSSYFETFTSL